MQSGKTALCGSAINLNQRLWSCWMYLKATRDCGKETETQHHFGEETTVVSFSWSMKSTAMFCLPVCSSISLHIKHDYVFNHCCCQMQFYKVFFTFVWSIMSIKCIQISDHYSCVYSVYHIMQLCFYLVSCTLDKVQQIFVGEHTLTYNVFLHYKPIWIFHLNST